MYKAKYKIQKELIDNSKNRIYTPFLQCYYLHSVTFFYNGISHDLFNEFDISHPYITLKGPFDFGDNDSLVFEVNYHYMHKDAQIFDHIIDNTYSDETKSNSIASKHYIEAQFSLDNGLYKNAVLNLGTSLETLLNKTLTNQNLQNLIDNHSGAADKKLMHDLRQLRNRVHPNRIVETQDVDIVEALKVREDFELILKKFK